jgi:hypothetical protein
LSLDDMLFINRIKREYAGRRSGLVRAGQL